MARGAFTAPTESTPPLQERSLSTGVGIRDTTKEDQQRIKAANTAVDNATLNMIGGVAQAVNQGASLASQVMETRAISQVQEELTSVKSELAGASEFPQAEGALFGKEAMSNPDFRESLKEMKGIKALQRTGRINRDFAVERFNQVVASAKVRNPAYAQSIEAAARDVLGFSPQQKFMETLMRQTPEEQAYEQLQVKAARLGVTPEDVQTMELSGQQLALQKQRFELLKVKGQYDGNIMGQETRAASALAYTQITDRLAAQIQAGGIQDPVATKAFIQQQFGAQRARLLANLPSNVDPSLVNGHVTTLTNEENRLLGMVDNGSIFKFMEQQKKLIVATAENDLLQLPVLGKIYATLGNQAGAEVMSTIAKFKDNPKALEAVFATGGKGASELSLGLILEGAEGAMDVLTGQRAPINEQEQRVASWFAVKELQNSTTQDPTTGGGGGMPPQKAVRMVDIVKEAGLDLSTTALVDPRVVRTIASTKETHGQVINIVDSYTSTLATEYQNLLASGQITEGQLNVTNGVITDTTADSRAVSSVGFGSVKRDGLAFTPEFGAGVPAKSPAYTRWITKANRLIKLGETYKATGVLPAQAYSDANGLLKTIITGINEQGTNVPTPSQVVRWGINEDGVPMRLED